MAKKIESMSIKQFMDRTRTPAPPPKKREIYKILPLAAVSPFVAQTAYAHSNEAVTVVATGQMYTKMVGAFDPLIEMIQVLAYPVAMVVVLGGALFIMIGNKEKGFEMMQGAALGTVLVAMAPTVLNILVDATKAI